MIAFAGALQAVVPLNNPLIKSTTLQSSLGNVSHRGNLQTDEASCIETWIGHACPMTLSALNVVGHCRTR
jgi:hypothetical protein